MGVIFRLDLWFDKAGAIKQVEEIDTGNNLGCRDRYKSLVWLEDEKPKEVDKLWRVIKVLCSYGSAFAFGLWERLDDDPLVEKPGLFDRQAHQAVPVHPDHQHAQQHRGPAPGPQIINHKLDSQPLRGNKLPRQKLHMETEGQSTQYVAHSRTKRNT